MYVRRRGLGAGSGGIQSLISSIATQKGISPALALAVAQHESGFDPNAQNSTSSAAGLFQLINATQQQYGVTNPYDPTQNTTAGVQFLSDMLKQYNGDQTLALMAYSCGPGNVNKYLSTGTWPSICDTSYPAAIANLEGSSAPTVATDTITSAPDVPIDMGVEISSVDWGTVLPVVAIGGLFILLVAEL